MKPRVVELDIKGQHHERGVGDAPSIGKVAKMSELSHKPYVEEDRRRRHIPGKRESTERVDAIVRFLFLASALIGIVLFVFLLVFWAKGRLSGIFTKTDQVDEPKPVVPVQAEVVVAKSSVIDEESSIELMRRALGVRTLSRAFEFFRFPDTTAPLDVINYLDSMSSRDGLMSGLEVLPAVDVGGRMLGRVLIHTTNAGETKQRLALLVNEDGEEWKVDFNALARACEPPVEALLDGSADEAILRVVAWPVDGSGSAPDGEDSLSQWRLSAGDGEVEMIGLCRASSEQAEAMARVHADGLHDGGRRATVVVRSIEGKPRTHVHISRVLAEDWVVFDEVFDEAAEETAEETAEEPVEPVEQ